MALDWISAAERSAVQLACVAQGSTVQRARVAQHVVQHGRRSTRRSVRAQQRGEARRGVPCAVRCGAAWRARLVRYTESSGVTQKMR